MRKLFNMAVLPTALALTLGLTACGKSDQPASGSNASSATKVDPNVLADKQEVVLNMFAEPDSLDPQKSQTGESALVTRQMLVGLTTTDPKGNIVPGMAEKWESADNKVWKFHLRDAKWSDGTPVTAEDFVYSFRRMVDPKTAAPYASYFADAKIANAQEILDGKAAVDTLGVKALDPKTLEITLSEPVPYFPDMMFHSAAYPVPKTAIEKFGDKWTEPANIVVNGPYKMTQRAVNDKVVLERNKSYFDDANTHVNKVTFLQVVDETTAFNRYKAGELDVTDIGGLPPEQFNQAKQELASEYTNSPVLCTFYWEPNHTLAPFNDPRVRRALNMTIDREVIATKVLGGGQIPAYQFTPTAIAGGIKNVPEWQNWDKAKRIEEAKKLLTEAGYSDAKPLQFDLTYNTNDTNKKISVATAEMWKQAIPFIKANLVNKEYKVLLAERNAGKVQIARAIWCADYNEASTFLNILKPGNSNNSGKYNSPVFADLMAQTLKAGVDGPARTALYNKVEAQLDTDTAVMPVFFSVANSVRKPYLIGFENDPLKNTQIKYLKVAKH